MFKSGFCLYINYFTFLFWSIIIIQLTLITTKAIQANAGIVRNPKILRSIVVQGFPGAQLNTFNEFRY